MRILALGLLILGLAGCSFAPEYQRPLMPMPETWKGEVGQGERLDLQWWRRFDDATLNALVEEALTYNRDIAAAVARVDTARARLGVARAELFPLNQRRGAGHPDVDRQHEGYGRYGGALLGGLRGHVGA